MSDTEQKKKDGEVLIRLHSYRDSPCYYCKNSPGSDAIRKNTWVCYGGPKSLAKMDDVIFTQNEPVKNLLECPFVYFMLMRLGHHVGYEHEGEHLNLKSWDLDNSLYGSSV